MKKNFTLLFAVLSTVFFVNATNNTSFGWSLAGGGAQGADRAADVVTDANGNIFTANYFLNSATFNGITLTGSPIGTAYNNSLFITKMSPDKTNLWKIFSNLGAVSPVALATTSTGDLIVTGSIYAVKGGATTTANIIDAAGTQTQFLNLGTSSYDAQSFVAKYNSNGIQQWVREINSNATKDTTVVTTAVTTDANGDVYLSGTYINSVILPGSSLISTTNSSQAAFITKLNGINGNVIWTKTSSGGVVSEIFSALTFASDGYLYAAGIFRNASTPVAVTFGSTVFTPTVGYDIILAKISPDGVVSYIQDRTNTLISRVKDLLVNNDKVYVAGSFKGNTIGSGIKFTNDSLKNNVNFENGYIAAFNTSNGSDLWHKGIIGAGIIDAAGLAIGSDNRLYVFGAYGNKMTSTTATPVDFGNSLTIPDTNPSNSAADIYLASYDLTAGTTFEVHTVAKSATNYETANALTCFEDNLYLVGSTNAATATFENATTYNTLGAYDFFLVNYSISATTGLNSGNNSKVASLYVDNVNKAIVIKNSDAVTAKIISVTGAIVRSLANQGLIENLSTQGIAAGVYVLKLSDKFGKTSAQRIIIQ